MDYDDGFVAYLNGVEIARGNTGLPGEFVAWNQALATDHEAVLYQGGVPDAYAVDLSLPVKRAQHLGHPIAQRQPEFL